MKGEWRVRNTNEQVLEEKNKSNNIIKIVKRRKSNWISYTVRRNCIKKKIIEGKIERKQARGRSRVGVNDI